MIIPEFTAPSYKDRVFGATQNCINLVPEAVPGGYVLLSTPGLYNTTTTSNNQPARGAYFSSTSQLFSVHNNTCYEIDVSGGSTSRGTLAGTSGLVTMADNGVQLFIVDAGTGAKYTLTMASGSVTAVADANCPSCSFVTYQAGYFIISKTGTGEIYLSALDDGTDWTPVLSAEAESIGDSLLGVYSNGTHLYLIGARSVEVWYLTGGPLFPFEPINGATYPIGCVDAKTICNINGKLYFAGSAAGGKGAVWEFTGTTPRDITTPYMSSLIGATNGDLEGCAYQYNGHTYYSLKASSSNYVYDISQDAWLEKQSFVTASYAPDRIRFAVTAFSAVTPICFDRINGKIYGMGGLSSYLQRYNSEDTVDIRRMRTFGPITDSGKRLFHNKIKFILDLLYDGTGSTSLSATLEWSDDGGLTFSTARTMTAAVTSSTTAQRAVLYANQLGSSRERFYRLTFTGPKAALVLKTCDLELKEGRF